MSRSELVKLDILINKEQVDALSFIVFKDSAYERGRKMCERSERRRFQDIYSRSRFRRLSAVKSLRERRSRQCVRTCLQNVTVAIFPVRKNCLEKQKEGKKRMRQVGNVEIPQEAFMSVLKLDED